MKEIWSIHSKESEITAQFNGCDASLVLYASLITELT